MFFKTTLYCIDYLDISLNLNTFLMLFLCYFIYVNFALQFVIFIKYLIITSNKGSRAKPWRKYRMGKVVKFESIRTTFSSLGTNPPSHPTCS